MLPLWPNRKTHIALWDTSHRMSLTQLTAHSDGRAYWMTQNPLESQHPAVTGLVFSLLFVCLKFHLVSLFKMTVNSILYHLNEFPKRPGGN